MADEEVMSVGSLILDTNVRKIEKKTEKGYS